MANRDLLFSRRLTTLQAHKCEVFCVSGPLHLLRQPRLGSMSSLRRNKGLFPAKYRFSIAFKRAPYYTVRQPGRGRRMTRIRKTQYPCKMLRKILDIGLLNTLWISLGGCFFYSWLITYSLWWGVFLWVLPNSYFANKLFQSLGQVPPAKQLNVFYRAEIIKLVLSGIIFVMLIQKISISIPALLVGYFMSQVFLAMHLVRSFHYKERFV